MDLPGLNPMVFYPGFLHIAEQIFKHLDKKSLSNCREVAKLWQECIDDRNPLWNRLVENKNYNEAFQWSCKNGLSNISKMLLKKSTEFKIELNAKDKYGMTAFLWACSNGQLKIAEMLLQKSPEFKIEMNAKYIKGRTAFLWA